MIQTKTGGTTIFLYTIIAAIIGIITSILLAACSKKASSVVYGKLDKAGRITNILLIPVYLLLSPLYLFFGMISTPRLDGFLGVVGWIVSIIIASAALFCSLGLGFSVALRKKGKSKLSFSVQFAGIAGIALTVVLYCFFVGNLLAPLN